MENLSEESDKRIKFLNEVWPLLQEEKDYNVIREFINKMVILNDEYRFNGGIYPDVMFVLGMARDEINSLNSELEKFKKMEQDSDSESDSEENKEKKRQEIKEKWLKSFEKT